MISILIKDDNSLYCFGLQQYLTKLFYEEFRESVCFLSTQSEYAIGQADIIIMALHNGEGFTCKPELKVRKESIILGIVEKATKCSTMPGCYADMILMSRDLSLDNWHEKITKLWKNSIHALKVVHSYNCLHCNRKELSEQQLRIMSCFYHGKTMGQIATELDINIKTIFSHKYNVMNKFGLRIDYELVQFLNHLADRQLYPEITRGGLNIIAVQNVGVG